MNRVLALTHSCIRSQTEVATKDKDGFEATANLAAVETAEPVTEAVSHKARDRSSSEYINGVLSSTFTPTIEDNTKRINELTKVVENKFDEILKALSLQNSQPINTSARSVVSSVNDFNSQINLTDSPSASKYMMTKTTAANNPTHFQDSLNIRTSPISSYPVTSETEAFLTTNMSPINTPLDNFSQPYCLQQDLNSHLNCDQTNYRKSNHIYGNNLTIEQLKRQIDILQNKVNKNPEYSRNSNQTNGNYISFNQEYSPEN